MSVRSEQPDESALSVLRAPANDPQPVADRLAARLKAVVSPLHFAEFYRLWQDRLPKGPKYDPVEYTREAAALLREIHRTVEATDPVERLAALAALVDLREVPDGARTLDANTLSILARHDGRMFAQVGMGTYIVHGALDGLFPTSLEDVKKVLRIGVGNNIQEGGKIGEFAEDRFVPFSETPPSIRSLSVDFGDGVSVAHGVHFAVRPGDKFAHWRAEDGAFLGIGAIIGNGVTIGKEAVVYHAAVIGHGAEVGAGSVVGLGARLADGVLLAPGTLVLDGSRIDGTPEHARNLDEAIAMIAEGRTPVVDDTEYLAHRVDYDAECVGPDGHRRFAVHVGCAEDSTLRFGRIAPKYAGAFLFARTHVVEDNMAFSRIDTLVGSLAHRLRVSGFPELSRFLVEEKAISYADPAAEIDGFLAEQSVLGRDLSHARERLIRSAEASSVLLLARPRDNDGFFETGFVEIVDALDHEDATEDGIHELLLKHFYRPEIDSESRFYGRSVLSGRVRVERSVVADSKIRCDETGEEGEAVVSDAAMVAMVVHGPRSKRIRGGVYWDGTVHNGTIAEDCEIGTESGSLPWVLNDATARRVSARGGGIAVNAETIEDETLAPGTVRHAGRAFPAAHPDEIAY